MGYHKNMMAEAEALDRVIQDLGIDAGELEECPHGLVLDLGGGCESTKEAIRDGGLKGFDTSAGLHRVEGLFAEAPDECPQCYKNLKG